MPSFSSSATALHYKERQHSCHLMFEEFREVKITWFKSNLIVIAALIKKTRIPYFRGKNLLNTCTNFENLYENYSWRTRSLSDITSAISVARADGLLLRLSWSQFRSGFRCIKKLEVWISTLPGDHLGRP